MTALAASRFGLPVAVAPAKAAPSPQRSVWSEPEPWIVAVLLATGVAVIARHPIARAIGTEVDEPTLTPSVVATAPPSATTPAAPAAAAAVEPVPTHAPRDPFRALLAAGGALLAPQAGAAAAATTTTTTTSTPPSAPKAVAPAKPVTVTAVGSCAGTAHVVAAGESLWSIAAKAVKSSDTNRVTVAWHRIYSANQPPLGSNPSLVPVGTKLCIPSSI